MLEFVTSILSGLAAAATVAGFFLRPINELKASIKRLEEDRINKLEERLDGFCRENNPDLIASRLDNLKEAIDYNSRIQRHTELKLGEIEKSVAELSRDVKGLDKWQNNLNTDFQDHIKDKELHHGR